MAKSPAKGGSKPGGVESARLALGPERHALVERVYDLIREQIFARTLVAGSRLNIDHIARELGVSATPVREAVNRLAAEGLATYEPYSGYMLSPPFKLHEIRKLQDVRALMETYAARTGAPLPSGAPNQMEAYTLKMESLVANMNFQSFKAFDKIDNDFHKLIVESADNPYLTESYSGINTRARITRLYYSGGPTDVRAVIEEHRAVLEAYRKRDGEAAARALDKHLQAASRRLEVMVEQFTGTLAPSLGAASPTRSVRRR